MQDQRIPMRKHVLIFFILIFVNSLTPLSISADDQWDISSQGISGIWDLTKGNENATIAMINSGIVWDENIMPESHRWENKIELSGVEGIDDDNNGYVDDYYGWDWVENDNDPSSDGGGDLSRSGTMLTSIISANHENGQIKGLAPDIKIMDLRILNNNGFSWGYLNGYYALEYAINNNATIINFAIVYDSEPIIAVKELLEKARNKGIHVIINSGWYLDRTNPWSSNENTLTITSGNSSGISAGGHNNSFVDFIAPGEEIGVFDGFNTYNATSNELATAYMSGIMGLLQSIRSDLPYLIQVINYTSFEVDNVFPSYVNASYAFESWLNFENIDFDDDGMLSWFEHKYNLDPFVDDASEDLDGDGISNLDEFNSGSDPSVKEVIVTTDVSTTDETSFPYWLFISVILICYSKVTHSINRFDR